MERTHDPDIVILEQTPGYVLYRHEVTGQEWEVRGTCDRRGDCIIGAVIQDESGDNVLIRDHDHIEELKQRLGVERLVSEMDVPVTPGFKGCCPFEITVTKNG